MPPPAELTNGNEPKRRRVDADAAAAVTVAEVKDVRITRIDPLITPAKLTEDLPATPEVLKLVRNAREDVAKILDGKDDRLVVVIGPCSVHDPKAALEFAAKLRTIRDELDGDLMILMRVYFEKPRTTTGWKGMINDPHMDGTFDISTGIRAARELLLEVNSRGLPAAGEFLDTISPQFLSDLFSWGAIGARTTESQVHRELASGMSSPIGFKNSTAGDVQIAVDAIRACSTTHSFLGVTSTGKAAIVHTAGNPNCHVILRGGKGLTNYDAESIAAAKALHDKAGVRCRLMIDCSHGNSRKQAKNQPSVADAVAEQVAAGSAEIMGVMIESHLKFGAQKLNPGVTDPKSLEYGKSITDECIDIPTTRKVLNKLAAAVRARRAAPAAAAPAAQ